MSEKYTFQALYQTLKTIKMNFEIIRLTSFQKPAISVRFNLLQVCPSVFSFVFAVLVILSLKVLSDYFYVSLNLVSVSTVTVLIKFETQLLKMRSVLKQ